jgi:hypothetical protein
MADWLKGKYPVSAFSEMRGKSFVPAALIDKAINKQVSRSVIRLILFGLVSYL